MDNSFLNNKDFLSIKEFALLIRVHENTVRNMIRTGKLNAFRVGDKPKSGWRIARSEINRMSFVDLEKIVEKLIERKI